MRPSSCQLLPGCHGLKSFDAAAAREDTVEAATCDPNPIRRPRHDDRDNGQDRLIKPEPLDVGASVWPGAKTSQVARTRDPA